jgi:hypothetical protein
MTPTPRSAPRNSGSAAGLFPSSRHSASGEREGDPGWGGGGERVTVRIRRPVADQETVTCVIPGQGQGIELYADLLDVDEGSLLFELTGSCAYQSTFAYSSDDASSAR